MTVYQWSNSAILNFLVRTDDTSGGQTALQSSGLSTHTTSETVAASKPGKAQKAIDFVTIVISTGHYYITLSV